MKLKKIELYRGFNIFAEEIRTGTWAIAVLEVPASELGGAARPPSQGRVSGEYPSKESALSAARTHIDRINKNRKNRATE